MPDIENAYARFAAARGPYLMQGSRNQRYTATIGRDPIGGDEIEQVRNDVHNDIGKIIVKALASTLMSVLFPPNIYWFRFVAYLVKELGDADEIQHQLSEAERDHMRLFDRLRLKSALYIAFLSAAIWGQVIIHLKEADEDGPLRTRVFDLADHVTEWTDGFLRRIITLEKWKENPTDPDEKSKSLYTEIDFLKGTVTQELEGVATLIEDDHPDRWIPISHNKPVRGQHFPIAFVTDHYKSILHANGMKRAFQEITYEAARVIKGVRPGSGLDPHKLNRLKSGAFIVMRRPEDLFYPEQQTTLHPGLVVVEAHLTRSENELRSAFMFGLTDRKPDPETATLVRQLIAELDNVGAQFYAHHQDETQLRIAHGLQSITGFVVEGEQGRIEPTILTGLSAISRHEEANLFVSLLERFANIAPEMVAGLPKNKIFQRVADGFQIETGDLITVEGQIEDVFAELIGLIEQDPQRVLGLLVKLLEQFDPEVIAQIAGAVQETALAETEGEQPQQPQLAAPAA